MTRILIEGWRGVNHSFAMVNQAQILALRQAPGIELQHRDMPFAMAHWTPSTHNSGFSGDEATAISQLPEPDGLPVDLAYRICSPYRDEPPAAPAAAQVSFMVTEMGLSSKSFAAGCEDSRVYTQGPNFIATPSTWSRDRLMEWGFDAHKIVIAHHGVDASTFRPLSVGERVSQRTALGFHPEEFVFLNLGATFWNKGVDVLLLAYATLRQKHRHIRLLLKDQEGVYGIGIDNTLNPLRQKYPALFTADTLASIATIKKNLNQVQLRALYGMADAYVSTYRAEGFNLPVLEAMACGVPVVVTRGGSTDDFCPAELALFVDSEIATKPPDNGRKRCVYREPNLDATIAAMERLTNHPEMRNVQQAIEARSRLTHRFSWTTAAQQIAGWAQAAHAHPLTAGSAASPAVEKALA